MRNQYFQLEFRDGLAFLKFFPADEEGKLLEAKKVTEYLDLKRFQSYDLKAIHEAIQLNTETELSLGAWDGFEINEMMDVDMSLDKMKAICTFFPPSNNGKLMDKEEILRDLAFKRIKYGIRDEEINSFLKDRQYCTPYVIALGKPPRHGSDAKIVYNFNVNKNLQPKRNEDGSVDYKELNTINHVQAGDCLAKLIPADPGEPGKNIMDSDIQPRNVKSLSIEYGNQISINEDKTEIYSDVTGHVSLVNGKVFVSNVYTVPADVDNSIGNIVYEGSVHVAGNVKGGFTIKASGDVIVEGIVENAIIEAGGQIVVKHGIHGMHKGVLSSRTNVIAKYIENATVRAGGYVEAEVILNSQVSALAEVRVHGRKGLINGGKIRSGLTIEAENLGTEMGTITEIEVGVDPAKKERFIVLNKEISSRSKEHEKAKVIINNYGQILKRGEHLPQDKLLYVQKLAIEYKNEQAELDKLRAEMREIRMEMMASDHSFVVVSKDVYPGVSISIGDLSYHLQNKQSHVKFKKEDGQIVSTVV